MISRFLAILSLAFAFAFATSAVAADKPAKKDDTVMLSPFVVTEKSRGIVPLNGMFRYSPFTNNLKSPVIITGAMHPDKNLADYTVEKEEEIIAINGQRILGMDRQDLVHLWMETGDAGESVKLTIRGTGENASTFREVTLKRIAPPKRPAPKS
jgi:hypothetical protein